MKDTHIPKTMNAAYIEGYGKNRKLTFGKLPVPVPKSGQVLVKVEAMSLNPRDWLLMRGIYPFKKLAEPFPIVPGSDISGTIMACGDNTSELNVGDDVFGMQPIKGKFGALAEYVAIDARAVAKKPVGVSHNEAAAMPCAGMTSFQTLRDLAKLKKGENILINGASGGVGSYAVQMAAITGARVTAVCGPTNQTLCRELGAADTINYKTENFEDHEDKYDVVYDVIGRSSLKTCKKCLRKNGRYISTIPSAGMFIQAILSKAFAVLGFRKGQTAHLILVKPEGKDLKAMADLVLEGRMKSLIDSTYPFEKAEDALDRIRTWRAKGKVIIEISH